MLNIEEAKAINIINRVINEPDFPKEGQQKLEFKDKSRCLLASYTSVLDNKGRVLSIVGRLEDIAGGRLLCLSDQAQEADE